MFYLSTLRTFFGFFFSVESLRLLCLYLSSATCLLLPVSALRSTTKPSVHYPACRNYFINKAANNPHASPGPGVSIKPSFQFFFLSPHTTSYIKLSAPPRSDSCCCLRLPPPLSVAAQVRCVDVFLLVLCSFEM